MSSAAEVSGLPQEVSLAGTSGRIAARLWPAHDASHNVLALHGWLDSAASFEGLAPLLPGLNLVAMDLPGHGHSDHRPPGTNYHFVDWMAEIRAVVKELGWKKYTLLGHSLGGAIVTLYAGLYPQEMEKLVVIEAMGPMGLPEAEAPERLLRHLEERDKLPRKRLPVYSSLETAAEARHAAGKLTLEAARVLAGRGTRPAPEGGFTWRSDPRLRVPSPSPLSEDQIAAFLKRIECPTLLIRAQEGIFTDDKWLARRCGYLKKDLEIRWVPGGHHVHLDAPASVAPLILEFMGLTGPPLKA